MKTICSLLVAISTLTMVGCDVDVYEESATPAVEADSVHVDLDEPLNERAEFREERRERIRDAVDRVDVEVDDGGVKIDVDGN